MSKLVTIFGGSGFVGRHIAQRMAREGWSVRVAVRRPNEALFVRTYGNVGQVEPVLANIRDEVSTREAVRGADAVINCVGILTETRRQNFDDVHALGAARIARIAAAEGVAHLVHISAIGAAVTSASAYARSKAAGEAGVRDAFADAVILRPSVIFGTGDSFFSRFAAMSRFGPILAITGAQTRFQPVHVVDVARAAVEGALGHATPGVYELGGPEADTFRALIGRMLAVVRRRRLVVNLPYPVAWLIGATLGAVQTLTLGLIHNSILTTDQVKQLRRDNVVSESALTLVDLGIEATAMDSVLESYLYKYRPAGQYTALQESARNLKA